MKLILEHKGVAAEVRSVALDIGGYGWAYVIEHKHAGWSRPPYFDTQEAAVAAGESAVRDCIDTRESTGDWPSTGGSPADGDFVAS